jgi:hypothetical protein
MALHLRKACLSAILTEHPSPALCFVEDMGGELGPTLLAASWPPIKAREFPNRVPRRLGEP